MKIDSDSPEHPYVQLAALLRERIRAAEMGPRVPSIMELANETGLSAATVKRALGLLRNEGIIFSVSGRGTFVADTNATERAHPRARMKRNSTADQ